MFKGFVIKDIFRVLFIPCRIKLRPSTRISSTAVKFKILEHTCSKCGHVDPGSDSGSDIEREVKTSLPRRVIRDKREFDNTYYPGVESATSFTLDAGGYTSRLNVFYLCNNATIWDIGLNGPWMLRDEPNNATNTWKKYYKVQQFLRKEIPMDVFDVDSTDSEDEEDDFKKFPKSYRQFMRWFKEICNHNSKDAGLTLSSLP
ncbi:hypothetical protein G7Y89_g15671 [Cudoniella acicularis]|uniref:Uncharacterized protein n=1 Tax=Cudoniella acicularis TaxID=354080 RepID=A0A8H4QHU5_9HELO|nr:hypothetical protein G7Y89_g15671 [Cudoniella acicularis]